MTERPGYTPDQLVRGLSLPRRVGYLVAGLGGLAAAVTVSLLWATEPVALPDRTRLSFALVIAIGAIWAGFGGWALARRPLFAVDRVIAASLALTFSALTTIVTAAVGLARASIAATIGGAGIGVALSAMSGVLLIRALAYRKDLLARRRDLERRTASTVSPSDTAAAAAAAAAAPERPASETRKPLPIGPLAIALRRLARRPGRHAAVLALLLAALLLVGVALLLR